MGAIASGSWWWWWLEAIRGAADFGLGVSDYDLEEHISCRDRK